MTCARAKETLRDIDVVLMVTAEHWQLQLRTMQRLPTTIPAVVSDGSCFVFKGMKARRPGIGDHLRRLRVIYSEMEAQFTAWLRDFLGYWS